MPRSEGPRPPKSGAANREIEKALSTPVRGLKDYVQIAVTIPKGHLRVLGTEAELLGLRRGQLLELLFMNRLLGQKLLVRPSTSPTYRFQRDEQESTERYLWYIRRPVKKLLREYLLKLGMRPSGLVVLMLNDWAHLGPDAPP
jgi:hypothetical protein